MNDAYAFQNKMVIYHLVNNYGYSIEKATELWFNSKTRHVIQEEEKGDWVSPARCLQELLMEVNHDPMWNVDIY